MNKENPIIQHVQSIPSMLEEIFWKVEADARLVVSTPDIYSTRDLYLFGSGDSYFACLGASLAFARLAGIDVHPVTSMQASRYTAAFLPLPVKNCLAIGVSNSGEAARAVEAMAAFAASGARTLALTGNPESRMAGYADAVFNVTIPSFLSAPGVRGYVGAQMALYLLAIRFAEVRGNITMDEAGDLRKTIYNYRESVQTVLTEQNAVIADFAKLCTKAKRVEFLAAGPSLASAQFCTAKIIEAYGIRATAQDAEEFAHVDFFLDDPQDIPTVLMVSSNSRSLARSAELIQVLEHLGRPLLVITDGAAALPDAKNVIRLQGEISEDFFPMFASVAGAALVAEIEGKADNVYFRGHSGPWCEKGLPDIRLSEIVLN